MGRFSSVDLMFSSRTVFLPRSLRFNNVYLYFFCTLFVCLDVLLPWIAHQIPGAGPTFLPLHFFVLLAGLIIGWRGGVLVGLFGTLISYLLSGMPVLHLLPQITLEIVVYGLAVGILRKNLRFKVVWSLFGAMILGRLARLAFTGLLLLGGVEISPLSYMWFVVVQGLPGIAIQLVVIPVVMHFVENWYGKKAVGRDLI